VEKTTEKKKKKKNNLLMAVWTLTGLLIMSSILNVQKEKNKVVRKKREKGQ